MPPDRWWLRLKFQLLVARDHVLIFVIVQLVKCTSFFLSIDLPDKIECILELTYLLLSLVLIDLTIC